VKKESEKTISCPNPDSAEERGVVSSCHIWLGSIQKRPGQSEAHTQAERVVQTRRSRLLIFSLHITTHAIEIEFSAPMGNQAIAKS
jgi:hypothetical protein